MALSPRLDLRQAQTLVMTPQLQQAIKLLQMSNLDLSAYVEEELQENPLLERAEPEEAATVENAPAATVEDLAQDDGVAAAGEQPLDTDYENVWESAPADAVGGGGGAVDWGTGGRRDFEDDAASLEQTLAGEVNLRDHLAAQLSLAFTEPGDRLIANQLLEGIDEGGYLRTDIAAVADQMGCPVDRVAGVLAVCQQFDPTGVFARDVGECLGLQLAELDRLDPAMQALLNHLDRLAAHDFAALRRICGVDDDDLADMLAEIRRLDPRPGLRFESPVSQPVVPDVIMRADGQGGWLVELNSDTLPRVLVNERYLARVGVGTSDKVARDYLNERLQSANWLVRSLHQRATTILKVASEIIQQQDRFFEQGVRGLKPLVLRDIADAIGMHESTVSRATAGKFMATPRGVFELKYFFTTAISGTAGQEAHSAEAVRQRIKELIDDEPPNKVLSDDRIVEILKAGGIDIARRTVAKYRESMRIPSSVQRRRAKAMKR